MEILEKSVMIVNYELEEIPTKNDLPQSFDNYITTMIKQIAEKNDRRHYKSRSNDTAVVASVLEIQKKLGSKDLENIFSEKTNAIATKLKEVEGKVQGKISKMKKSVRVGTFVQVLYKENSSVYYFLGKTQHKGFVDENDYSSKKGFPDDNFNIWRSCIFDITDVDKENIEAEIFTDTEAKYWANDFLELDELNTDERNTKLSFKSIETYIAIHIKRNHPHDSLILKNNLIHYYRSNKQISYGEMINSVFKAYSPTTINTDIYKRYIEDIEHLPQKNNFDTQFVSVPKEINSRIRAVYDIRQGLQLKISDSIDNIQDKIFSYESNTGERYIVLETDNLETFRAFRNTSKSQ